MIGSGVRVALFALLLVGALAHQAPLSLLALALLGADGLSALWYHRCLTGVEYRRRLSHRQVAFGETVELEIEIVNRKLLPLSWLEAADQIPTELPPTRGHVVPSHWPRRSILSNLLALRPYERVRRRYSLPCRSRGEHVFGPLTLRSGDLFGLVTRDEEVESTDSLVVYPRVLPLADLGLAARQPLGDLRAHSWLFEDASRIAGAREYRPGDGMRRIHWAASARTQQLQAKVYEATTSHRLAIFLDLSTGGGAWWQYGYEADVLELSIVTAASIANWALERRFQVGLFTNGLHRGSWGNVSVPTASDPDQLERILLALGKLQPLAMGELATVLARTSRELAFGTTVVIITSSLGAATVAEALAMRGRGHAVTVVQTGESDVPSSLDGLAVRRIGPPGIWRRDVTIGLPYVPQPPRSIYQRPLPEDEEEVEMARPLEEAR